MSKDIIVVVNLDTTPVAANVVDVLLVSTAGVKDAKSYTSLDDIKSDWKASSAVYKKACALFNQGSARPAPESLIRKVTIVGMAVPTTPAELVEAIKAYQEINDDWYVLMTDQTEDAYVTALAEFAQDSEPPEGELTVGVEDRRKLYIGQTINKNLAVGMSRAAIIYSADTAEHADAAWAGAVLPWYPKAVTWKFKMPAGLTVPKLTDSEVDTLEGNNINFVCSEYKRHYIKNGCCSDGNWIDAVIGGDWVAKTIREKMYDIFLDNVVIPYDDSGFTQVAAAVIEAFDEATNHGIIMRDNESGMGQYEITVPKRSEATEEQAKNRVMPDIPWTATLGGAIHGVKITGTLKVTLS
ncbi:MAG: DUF3383 family protein [Lachnospiraceae bacterium]